MLQLNPIGEDGREIGVQHHIEGHVLTRRVAVEQAKHLPNDLVEIEPHSLNGRPLEQGAHSSNDLAGVLAVLDDPFCGLHGLGKVRRRRGQPSQAGVSVGDDGGQRLIDFMSNGRRHFPQACDPCHMGQLRLRPPQRLFRLFALGDVFGERHQEPRHALGAGNEGHVVADPDRAAVLASVLLLDLKLRSLSFEQLGDELPIGFAVILVGQLQEGECADFLPGVTQHFLKGGVGGQKAAALVREGDTDGRILEDCPPPLLALAQGFFGKTALGGRQPVLRHVH